MVKGVIADLVTFIYEAFPDAFVLFVEIEYFCADGKEGHFELGEFIQQNFQILQFVQQKAIVVGESHALEFAAAIPDEGRGEIGFIVLKGDEPACGDSQVRPRR